MTNQDLKVECMTIEQLKKMWEQGSKVKALSDIDPRFPDAQLSLFGPGTDSGTFEFFTEEINGEEGNTRKDYQPPRTTTCWSRASRARREASATSASPTTSRTRTTWGS